MEKDVFAAIITEYDQQCQIYAEFTEKVKELVKDLVKENGARVHSITSRVKERSDIQRKLERAEEKYIELNDITDISGIRIITYFADEVDRIAEIIQKEFDIDEEHSVDKRELLDPDRFGYLSLHYVAKLSATRLKLTEYQRFSDCKVEIQIRSILQHTWAEIEHDLGYKSKQAVPKEIRRRFSRLAGLLELADDEFEQIRDSLREYEATVSKQIADTPTSVLINQASLSAFIKNSSLVHRIDRGIASMKAGQIIKDTDAEMLSNTIAELHYVGFETIADIDSSLQKLEEIIYGFAKAWVTGKLGRVSTGICLFYLCYVMVGHKNSVEQAYTYLNELRIGLPGEQRSNAERIVSIYNRAATKSQKKP